MILLRQRGAEDADEIDILGDAKLLHHPLAFGLKLGVVINEPQASVALLANLLKRLEQKVDPFPVDQLADVEDVEALLVRGLFEMLGAKDVGGNAVGDTVDLVPGADAGVVARLRLL